MKISLVTLVFQFSMLFLLLVSNRVLVEPYFVWQTHEKMRVAYRVYTKNPITLKQIGVESGYKLSLVNKFGTVVESSSPEYSQGTLLSLPKEQLTFFLKYRNKLIVGRPYTNVIDAEPQGQSVIQLVASLGRGQYLLITQPLKEVRSNIQLAGGFFLGAGAILLVLTIFGSFIISWRFVKPVLDLTDIAGHIAALDFSRKYHGKRNDEIGRLGESMNEISNQMDCALSDVKKANKDLQEQMENQRRFLANVSHEFKTPLGLIRGYTEILENNLTKEPEDNNNSIDIILEETDRLATLIDDIIELTRLGNASFSIKKTSINMTNLLMHLSERFAPALRHRDLSLKIDADRETMINADEMRCTEVFDNLMSNAIRNADSGTVITINVCHIEKYVKVDIINQGASIPNEELERVFEPFARNGQDRNRASGGSGLGLSIVREIMRLHDGSCKITNYENGLCVTLKFLYEENSTGVVR
jgi:signal transduction histidine kinase